MKESNQRIIDGTKKPDKETILKLIGNKNYKRWTYIVQFIKNNYPGVFIKEDWIYGEKKHGWVLRYKKSKSLCTLIPERNRLVIQIVLGTKEREQTEMILSELNPIIRQVYKKATTYHDGKWLFIAVDDDAILDDIIKLLTIKRKPKKA